MLFYRLSSTMCPTMFFHENISRVSFDIFNFVVHSRHRFARQQLSGVQQLSMSKPKSAVVENVASKGVVANINRYLELSFKLFCLCCHCQCFLMLKPATKCAYLVSTSYYHIIIHNQLEVEAQPAPRLLVIHNCCQCYDTWCTKS